MNPSIVRRSIEIDLSAAEVFAWHMQPAAFERLIPPWQKVRVISRGDGPSHVGSRLEMQVKLGPFWMKWVAEHQNFEEGKSFTDVQVKGPFPFWKHIHRVIPLEEKRCRLEEEVQFLPPFGVKKSWIEKQILKMLQYRQETIAHDLAVYQTYPSPPLKILVSGSHGFIGSTLIPFLKNGGHEVTPLVRKGKKGVFWNPKSGEYSLSDFEGFDAVIHLAGKNLASGVWTKKFKKQLFQSRCRDSWLLSQILSRTERPPATLISASAIGFYGDRGEETLTEKSPPGAGFLAQLCEQWERSFSILEGKKTRLVYTRFGAVFSPKGGMLARLLPHFRVGLGAVTGSGKQWISWIALDDLTYALYSVLTDKRAEGPFNFTTPYPERGAELADKLAHKLKRPRWLRMGESFLKLAFGTMAEELFLSSVKVLPEKLTSLGFEFSYPKIEDFMDHSL